MIVGSKRHPIKFILLAFDNIAKTPREEDVRRTTKPKGLENKRLTIINMPIIIKDNI